MATSTPNLYIKNLADKYGIELFTNDQPSNIAGDWNFALSKVKTPIATIAHQDDLYKEEYVEKILDAVNYCKHPLIAFSDYSEIRDGKEFNFYWITEIQLTQSNVELVMRGGRSRWHIENQIFNTLKNKETGNCCCLRAFFDSL